ncbi:MAG TPA: hypothetical protein VGC95_03670, partial [Chitinophagaceae bacterium]
MKDQLPETNSIKLHRRTAKIMAMMTQRCIRSVLEIQITEDNRVAENFDRECRVVDGNPGWQIVQLPPD